MEGAVFLCQRLIPDVEDKSRLSIMEFKLIILHCTAGNFARFSPDLLLAWNKSKSITLNVCETEFQEYIY